MIVKLLPLSIAFAAYLQAQSFGHISIEGHLQGVANNSALDVSKASIIVGEHTYVCQTGQGDVLCSVVIPLNTDYFRLEISAVGYKTYSRNVPGVQFDTSQNYHVNLGTVPLQLSELPEVAQVIPVKHGDQVTMCRIELKNTIPDLRIRRIEISARAPLGAAHPCEGLGPYQVKINDRLQVSTGGGKQQLVKGAFVDLAVGRDYTVIATGFITIDDCAHQKELSLTLPVSIPLPTNDHSIVDVEVPQVFRLEYSPRSSTSADGKRSKVSLAAASELVMLMFTDKENALPIRVSCPLEPTK